MRKIMYKKLDSLDRKILTLLNSKPRASYSLISKQLGRSKEVINYRVKRLMDQGIIEGFATRFRLGYWSYKMLIQLENVGGEEEKTLISYLKKMPNVSWVTSCSGNWNLALAVMSKDPLCFYETMQEILNEAGIFLKQSTFAITIKSTVFGHRYISTTPQKGCFPYKKPLVNYTLDKDDRAIARVIHTNARSTLRDIGRATNLPPETIRYRIKRMEKSGVIKGYRTIINPTIIGFQRYGVFITCSKLSREIICKFEEYARANPCISFFAQCVGSWDIELTVNVRNSNKLRLLILALKKEFAGHIRSLETIILFHTKGYYTYLPQEFC